MFERKHVDTLWVGPSCKIQVRPTNHIDDVIRERPCNGICSHISDPSSDESHFISTFATKTLDLIRLAHGTHLQQVMEVALQEFPVVFEHVSGRVTGERPLTAMHDHGVPTTELSSILSQNFSELQDMNSLRPRTYRGSWCGHIPILQETR